MNSSWLDQSYTGRILITGALGNIGEALVKILLAETSATLILVDARDPIPGEIDVASSRVTFIQTTTPTMGAAQNLINQAGHCHAVIHLASVFENDDAPQSLSEKEIRYHRALSSNLTNAYCLSEAYIRSLDKAAPTPAMPLPYRLIFTSSLSFRRGAFEHASYSAAKGGLVGLLRAYSKRLAPKILVNGIAPGIIDSKMAQPVISSRGEKLRAQIPLARWGSTSEVAWPIVFLLSPASSYITGQVINIDGGIMNS